MINLKNVTLWIIGINVILFLLIFPFAVSNAKVLSFVAFNPADFVHGINVWTLITSVFMHGSPSHLFLNMFSLMFIGGFLERLIGSKRFLGIYLISGIFANLFYVLVYLTFGIDSIPAVGASGAIFGIAGMLAVLTPKMPIYIMFIPVAMPMWFGVTLMLAVLWVLTLLAGLPIGNEAHLGGLLCGLAYAFYLRKKHWHKARIIARYYS